VERIRQVSAGVYPLTLAATDEDGAAVTVTETATITIYDGAGDDVESGTPDIGDDDETLSYAADPAKLAELDEYRIVWTAEVNDVETEWTTRVELCGGYLFDIPELRSWDDAFSDAERYPAAKIRAARTVAEVRLETAAKLAFVPRAARTVATGDGGALLYLPHTGLRQVRSISEDGAELSEDQLAELTTHDWGALERTDGSVWTTGCTYAICYEHGLDSPPEPVRQAAMTVAVEYLVRSALSSRATVEATDVGFFRLSHATPDTPTGIPEVDEIIREFGRRRPRIF